MNDEKLQSLQLSQNNNYFKTKNQYLKSTILKLKFRTSLLSEFDISNIISVTFSPIPLYFSVLFIEKRGRQLL